MKYLVTSRFIDKNTNELFEVGTVYETNNQERAIEIKKAGYLGELIEDISPNGPYKQLLSKNVSEITSTVDENYTSDQIRELLQLEAEGENRKGVKKHLENLLKGEDDESGATE